MMNRLLPFLLILISSAVLAESGAYRVEVIVFRNLNVESESTALDELRSFSHYPDSEETGQSNNPSDLPDDLKILPEKSEYMNNIWRRLSSSQDYRPLKYAAWEQNRTDYYPPMRVHDENIITTELRPPTDIMVADLAEEDPLAAYRSTFYQLDGSVQLRRSRFLHLFLDLEYRVNTGNEDPILPLGDGVQVEPELDAMTDYGPAHEVFTLRQNRQIRTGEVQYFDTPYLGALVFVSAISPE